MKKTISMLMLAIVFGAMGPWEAHARTIRATELDQEVLSEAMSGACDDALIIEFRQGDQLPLTVKMEGDLVETIKAVPTTVAVMRNFFLRYRQTAEGPTVSMSWDGASYLPVHELISGTMTVGASGIGSSPTSGVASAIEFSYKWLVMK